MSQSEKELGKKEIESLRKQWQSIVDAVYKPFLETYKVHMGLLEESEKPMLDFKKKDSKDPIRKALASMALDSISSERLFLFVINQLVKDVKNLGDIMFLVVAETIPTLRKDLTKSKEVKLKVSTNIEKALNEWLEREQSSLKAIKQLYGR